MSMRNIARDSATNRRLHHLNLDIRAAKSLIVVIQNALPNISIETWSSYQRLTRILTNAECLLATFRKNSGLNLCQQAPRDLATIRYFVRQHKEHFPEEESDFRRMLRNRRPNVLPVQEPRILRSIHSNHSAHSHTTSIRSDVGTRRGHEVVKASRPSQDMQRAPVIDLTLDSSDEDLVIFDNDPKLQKTHPPVSFSFQAEHRRETEQTHELEGRYSAEERAGLEASDETEDWRAYELRRDLLLWYEPEEHFDIDMLP